MNIVKIIFSAILLIVAITTAKAQNNNRFTGTYNVINEEGQTMEQTIQIFYKDDNYYFQAEGAEAYKMTASEDGKELRIVSEESGKINDDGSVEVNLGGDVHFFYQNDKLLYEMTVPDLGTEKYVLQKQ